MEESRFDLLSRHAARQTTRRGTLGALIGGALLLHGGESEATKKGERRKRRKQRQKKRKQETFPFDGVKVTVFNYTPAMNYSAGTSGTVTTCCKYLRDARLEFARNTTTISKSLESAWFWLNDGKYWFDFTDPLVGKPFVRIAFNGRSRNGGNCCLAIPFGQTVEARVSFDMGQTREVNVAGQVFTISRVVDFDQASFHLQIGSLTEQP